MFYVVLITLAAILVAVNQRHGPRAAVAWGFAAALLLPTSMHRDLSALECNIRLAIGLLLVGCVISHRGNGLPRRLILADFLVAGLVLTQMGSELLAGDLAPSTMLDIGFQWGLPYALGRVVLNVAGDVDRLVSVVAVACVALCLWSAGESISKVNPVNAISGHSGTHDYRWGLKRAEGPAKHPIYFGMMLVMLLPWTLEAANRAMRYEGPGWWKFTPLIVGTAVFFTLSRGPQLGALMTVFATVFFRRPRWRVAMAVSVLVAGTTILSNTETLLESLHAWSDETTETQIVVAGEVVDYSGTTHRLIQFDVYREAMLHAGLFGYGSERLSRRSISIPYVEEHLQEMFSSIDNHYILFVLRAGYLGITLWVLLGLYALTKLAKLALDRTAPNSLLAASLFGSLASIMLLVLSVWFDPDFGFVWLFCVGLSTNLTEASRTTATSQATHQLTTRQQTTKRRKSERQRSPLPARKLVPGHPVHSKEA